ncbi:MAG: SDR family oxidoreductase [Acidimicrobiales bacterium]|nr:SDR family oxidoreductase [Acidimicrobiales bacterium]
MEQVEQPLGERHAVVTGGGKGIGASVALQLSRLGARVTVLGRDTDALAATAATLGPEARWATCDVADEAQVTEVFASLGAVDILVNNAGVAASAPIGRTSLAEWDHQLRVNATGPFLCTRAVLDPMRERGWGRVITVASVAGLRGAPYVSAYVASKHAAVGLVRAAAAEVAGTGVTVNAVCPAYVRTEMTERTIANIVERTGRSEAEATAALIGSGGLGRLIEPEEVADAVAWLAAERAGAVNGEVIVIDGGG